MITKSSEDKLLRSVALRNADAIRIARQRAEQQAEATLQEQANLLNLTHDSIFVREMNGTIRYWNRAAEQLYGWAKEQAVGRPPDGGHPGDQGQGAESLLPGLSAIGPGEIAPQPNVTRPDQRDHRSRCRLGELRLSVVDLHPSVKAVTAVLRRNAAGP